jgi:molybdopterin-guanine dinucleotide biosynthesis protein A
VVAREFFKNYSFRIYFMDTKRKPPESMSAANMRRFEICILAGGSSSRMGRDKSRLRLGGQTLLAHIRATARMIGLPHRIIRRDLVVHCGPLGGIYTALVTSRADATLFLSCDMPFVSPDLLRLFVRTAKHNENALFVESKGQVGFPLFLFRRTALPVVESQLEKMAFSLQQLSQAVRSQTIQVAARQTRELFNVNTPDDLRKARALWSDRRPGNA